MRFENRFDVDAPLEDVWAAVLDVERVAPTVPGAQVLERTGENAYKVAIKVKVGPMSMTYRGDVEITERDDAAHRAVMKARAKESRGQGMADADVTMVLGEEGGRTAATVTTEVELSGKVATMGQGVLQDVSGRLVQTFATNLAAMLEGTRGEPAAGTAPDDAQAKTAGEMAAASEATGAGVTAAASEATAAGMSSAGASTPVAGTSGGSSTGPPGTAADGASEGTGGAAAATTPSTATAASGAPSAGGAGGGAAASPPPAAGSEALDLGALGGAMLADRLRDPRRLAGLVGFVALVSFLLGRRSRR